MIVAAGKGPGAGCWEEERQNGLLPSAMLPSRFSLITSLPPPMIRYGSLTDTRLVDKSPGSWQTTTNSAALVSESAGAATAAV